ncbi:MAG: ABC transporter permease [Dehalococcoidia bacterium]|nr:ABC transporter permease [Dehalococcoidia bacterium]
MSKKSILLSIVALLVIWAAASLIVDSPILPGPWAVLSAFVLDLPRSLGWHTVTSASRILVSLLISTAIALPLGLVLGQSKRLSKIFRPFIYITFPIPKFTLLPIIILFLGIGETSKIFLLSLILFYQILIIVWDASAGVRPELVHSVRSLGATRFQLLRYVYLPACLPAILTSLRISTGIVIAVLYLAESFAAKSGLGYYIMDTWQALAYPKMYSAILTLCILGLILYFGFDQMEKRLCRWAAVGQQYKGLQ